MLPEQAPPDLARLRRRWRFLLVAAFAAGLATFSLLALLAFDRLRDPGWLAVVLLINAVGDLVAAAAAQLLAPTRIRLRPGETGTPQALVLEGFGAGATGHVRAGGERWRARLAAGSPAVAPGETVEVRDREGLVLIVARPGAGPGQAPPPG